MASFKIKYNGKKKSVFSSGKQVRVAYANCQVSLSSGLLPLNIDKKGNYFAKVDGHWQQIRRDAVSGAWSVL